MTGEGKTMLSDKSSKPVAVVTGANRGIGLETVRQLAQRDIRVILTSRNAAKGEMALEKLLAEGLDVLFQPLDVASENSVAELGAFIHSRCGRVDILVNASRKMAVSNPLSADTDAVEELWRQNVLLHTDPLFAIVFATMTRRNSDTLCGRMRVHRDVL